MCYVWILRIRSFMSGLALFFLFLYCFFSVVGLMCYRIFFEILVDHFWLSLFIMLRIGTYFLIVFCLYWLSFVSLCLLVVARVSVIWFALIMPMCSDQ
mmetsp:Transcript_32378/g.5856  ORF Transcript_32378/g.5856 Transcript_32378/m.5856 type:complete len:98 (-) Transcript_32378:148-441(-)